MKNKILVLLLTVICGSTIAQQTAVSNGDTLIFSNKTEIDLYENPEIASRIEDVLNKGDVIKYLNYLGNGYYKIIPIKGEDISEEYLNDTLYIKSLYGFNKTSVNPVAYPTTKADKVSTELNSPGNELIKFTNRYYLGFSMMFISSGTVITNALVNDSPESTTYKAINITAGVVGLIGLIIELESFSHARKAGFLLNENGIGIRVPIK